MKKRAVKSNSGFFPRKRLGQHFLIDKNAMYKVVRVADLRPDDLVLEIGPGRGEMTSLLAERSRRVIAVEIDKTLASQLAEKTAFLEKVDVIHGDALKVDFEEIRRQVGGRMKVVANLPYQISTPLLMRLVTFRHLFSSMVLMLQKEVALRVVGKPGSKEYGSLSVILQVYTTPTIEMFLPPDCFFPRPKVASALVRFLVHETPRIEIHDEKAFRQVVRSSFGHRRKILKNSLKSILPEDCLCDEIEKVMDIDLKRRGETLSLEEFARLTEGLIPYLSSCESGS
ncbi:MAG: ribosomal RNA small subunit methyltransferase A [Proteobacteria bacterium]|nr:ribosomal RNA small subunit methyltransferase A [Pseudomonadota bacterium]